jgi:hypothetical protein
MKKTGLAAFATLILFWLTGCGYPEKGHANTPAENPGSQIKVGTDTIAHPGNIDRDTFELEK